VSEAEDLVRDVFARWNEGERDFDDAVFEESLTIHSALTGDVYEGLEGLQTWAAEIDDQFKDWNLVVEETEPVSEDRVVVKGEIRMTGRQSDVAIEQPASWVVDLAEGRIAVIRNFIGRESAADFARSDP
jgi:ketosteroid isomerase-like protein